MLISRIIILLVCAASVDNESLNNTRLEPEKLRVIIVGGGASGIAAAARLEEGGITDFRVVEGGPELGGRVRSRRMGDGWVELGAYYIHGEEGNVVHELADKWRMLHTGVDTEYGRAWPVIYDDGEVLDVGLVHRFNQMCGDILNDNLNMNHGSEYGSLGEYVEDELDKRLDKSKMDAAEKRQARDYLQYYGKSLSVDLGSGSWFQAGLEDTFEEVAGYQYGTFGSKYSYQDFIIKLGSHIGGKVALNEKVSSIIESDSEVLVRTNKKKYTCQYVIITVSLGVLKHGDMTFLPPLPAVKLDAINNLGFGTVGKVFLEYPQPWAQIDPGINPDYGGYNFMRRNAPSWKDDPTNPWQDGVFEMIYDSKNPTVMTLWLNGHSARAAAILPAEQLLREADSLVRQFLLPSLPNLPSPISAMSPSWFGDPLFRGTYSFTTTFTSPGSRQVLARPVGRKLWGGEATSSDHYGTVHGAIEAGRREADRIKASFNRGQNLLFSFYAFICGNYLIYLFV